jgi:site-specific recombinase XerD
MSASMCAKGPRSLPVTEWPAADRDAWERACRPGQRLRSGGRASRLKPITRNDLARRYGYFLDHLARSGRLDLDAAAGHQVTPANVERFLAELRVRVSSVTQYGSIHKLHHITALISPERDLTWLKEIGDDLRLTMAPRSKYDRLVLAEVLVGQGLALMVEADSAVDLTPLQRARQYRNGLMIALLACCPIRLKNFAALEVGRSLIQNGDDWWIVLAATETKERRPDERRIPRFLADYICRYLGEHRPALARPEHPSLALWLSSRTRRPMTYGTVEHAVIVTTKATVGVAVSPHLFRTSAATSAAMHGGATPHLASALLNHRHPVVTQEHYNRASSMSAASTYMAVIDTYKKP